jgi:hypothetical protein
MKLYRVTLKGMTYSSLGSGTTHGDCYVVANNTEEAYRKVREYIDKKDFGFAYERELNTVQLLAESDKDYPACGKQLFL